MPVLPIIDLLLLAGWTSLLVGFVLKVADLLTRGNQSIFSLSPIDFLIMAVVSFLFAIALAARTWVASQSPAQSAARRREETLDAYGALQGDNYREPNPPEEDEDLAASASRVS